MEEKAIKVKDRKAGIGQSAAIDIIFLVAFAAALVFLIWKCQFGFGNVDEAFYMTTPYRLVQGDGLFQQEWHLSQMCSFLIMPIMKVYMMIVGNTEGIILNFRYIYTALQALGCLFIYYRLRKINKIGAGLGALAFMIYAPFGIMAMSYNSLGILDLSVALVTVFTAKKMKWLQYIIAGLFFAGAVLCNPYLITLYAVFFAAVVIASIWRKKKRRLAPEDSVYTFKTWLFITIGCAAVAAAFGAFVLSRAEISKIIESIPYMLIDPYHVYRTFKNVIETYASSIITANKFTILIYCMFLAELIFMLIDRKREQHRKWYWIAASAITFILMMSFMVTFKYINFTMFPLNVLAFFGFVLYRNEMIQKLFCRMWIPAMIYTFCIHWSSNQEFYAISSSSTAAIIGSIMIIVLAYKEAFAEESRVSFKSVAAVALAVILFVSQFACEGYMRYKSVFWESLDILQDTKIAEGPEKGVYASAASQQPYDELMDIKKMVDSEYPKAQSVAFVVESSWAYLIFGNLRAGTNSTWLAGEGDGISEEAVRKQMSYYEINPDKIPDLVYFDYKYTEFRDYFEELDDYKAEDLANGGLLLIRSSVY